MSDEHEQKITEVVRKYRELESGEDGGVGVSLPGSPDALPVYPGGARAFTPAAPPLVVLRLRVLPDFVTKCS